jgi:polyisoprenoid-binding protein YceI
MNKSIKTMARRLATGSAALLIGFQGQISSAAAPTAEPGPPAMTAPPAAHYHLDKSHASLQLRVSHLGFSTYTTRFSRFDADLTFDPANIATSKLEATIDAASIEMDSAPSMCLDIVKGPQLLDTTKFPTITFHSGKIRMTGVKSFEILGSLNLHGVTRPLVLVGTYNGGYSGIANMDPSARIGFSAHGTFKRSDFGMAFGVPAPGTTMGVGDAIEVSIEAEFNGPPLAAAATRPPG